VKGVVSLPSIFKTLDLSTIATHEKPVAIIFATALFRAILQYKPKASSVSSLPHMSSGGGGLNRGRKSLDGHHASSNSSSSKSSSPLTVFDGDDIKALCCKFGANKQSLIVRDQLEGSINIYIYISHFNRNTLYTIWRFEEQQSQHTQLSTNFF
jgi:hypothetical protein